MHNLEPTATGGLNAPIGVHETLEKLFTLLKG